jgi:DNA phosphorothioation-dependent restriction protein DptG
MELYTFIYCAQLGLNIKNWKDGNQPKSRSLFFILDTEKASSERSNLKNYGFQNVLKSMANVFPILSILEYLNNDEEASKSPLWAFAQALNVASVEEERVAFNSICDFLEKFRKARNLPIIGRIPTNSIEALEKLIEYGIKQFEPGIGGKFSVKQKYVRFFERGVAKNFVRSRGRAGKVLVINQDFILLLTNLSIGDSKSMRFQELIYEFNQRGFYFDKISQETLIAFYERVGNVTRMSDSGDAVYVRSTI